MLSGSPAKNFCRILRRKAAASHGGEPHQRGRNMLTLLAMVLAIGPVVDDAIIVVENVHRHMEHGATPVQAALASVRELASPILVMATTPVAVFSPMAFIGGLIGQLFSEFAFTVVAAVFMSMVTALIFAPMLASHVLKAGTNDRMTRWADGGFSYLKGHYALLLHHTLQFWPVTVTVTVAGLLTLGVVGLFVLSPQELAPPANQGIVYVNGVAQPTATLGYMTAYDRYLTRSVFDRIESRSDSFAVNGVGIGGFLLNNDVMAGVVLKPNRGAQSTQEVREQIQRLARRVPGLKLSAFGLPPLPGAAVGLPVQFIITSIGGGYAGLDHVARKVTRRARASGLFSFVCKNLKYDDVLLRIRIHCEMLADFGITAADVGKSLATPRGGNYVNYYSMDGLSYRVVPQVPAALRANPGLLQDYMIKTPSGVEVPLSIFVSLKSESAPTFLPQFQNLPAVFITGSPAPGVSLGEALGFLRHAAASVLPRGYQVHDAGVSRQFMQQGNTLFVTFGFALLMVVLLLAAQFDGFRDAVVVICAVPLALFGALLPIALGLSSIDIYSEVGLVMLIGLIAKQGILVVKFARHLPMQRQLGKREAVIEAATLRLRPILMTVAAMIAGAVPLVLASGGNAQARFSMGLVIISGLGFGSLVALFVIPSFYLWFGQALQAGSPTAAVAEMGN
jgi:multidrug efflux pump